MSLHPEASNNPEQLPIVTGESQQLIGHSALSGVGEGLEMPADIYPIPRGWTTLIHGTNTNKWTVGQSEVVIKGHNGLSAITTEDAEQDRRLGENFGNPNAFNTTNAYINMLSTADSSPVEVRTLFYREELGKRRRASSDINDIRESLSEDTINHISRFYQPRHPIIPRKEILLRLGAMTDDKTGKITEYFVPASVANDYHEAVLHEANGSA